MPHALDRRTFVQNTLCCAAACGAAMAAVPALAADASPPAPVGDPEKAATVHDWLTQFITTEEKNLDQPTLFKLLEQRGRQCCARLDFRQKLAAEAGGDVDKLVELMGKIVGAENCVRSGDTITLVYPSGRCGCGWNPKRETPSADDPYCNCSMANNQRLFEFVSGRKVNVQLTDSPRRNGKRCRFIITLA